MNKTRVQAVLLTLTIILSATSGFLFYSNSGAVSGRRDGSSKIAATAATDLGARTITQIQTQSPSTVTLSLAGPATTETVTSTSTSEIPGPTQTVTTTQRGTVTATVTSVTTSTSTATTTSVVPTTVTKTQTLTTAVTSNKTVTTSVTTTVAAVGGGGGGGGGGGQVTTSSSTFSNITTAQTSSTSISGGGLIKLSVDSGQITTASLVNGPSTGLPRGSIAPFGWWYFQITGLTPGKTVLVTLTFPSTIPPNAHLYKSNCGSTTGGYTADSLVRSIVGNALTMALTDGGAGDCDTVSGQITDPGGILLLPDPVTTTVTTTADPTAPSLGAADSFAVLAGSIATNTGPTMITGNLGVSPSIGVPPHVTGFPPGGLTGATHDADGSAAAAQADDTIAFGFIDQGCTTTYSGVKDLVGLSLVAGVYCADAFQLSGTLTLSGTGVWIFKSASTLITSGTAKVVGGDQCSVWWRVVSSATLGTNTQLTGNILALTSITLNTGATLNGRALAQTGEVKMDANTISISSCGSTTTTSTSTTGGHGVPEFPQGMIALLGLVLPIIILLKKRSIPV